MVIDVFSLSASKPSTKVVEQTALERRSEWFVEYNQSVGPQGDEVVIRSPIILVLNKRDINLMISAQNLYLDGLSCKQ